MNRALRLPLLVLAVVAVAGCGDGGSNATGLGAITSKDLAIMVLPALEIGQPAAAHIFDPDSGYQSAANVADHTLDPHDTADDIKQAGLNSDYLLSYISSTDPTVSTEVALFDTADQASEFVETTVGEAERYTRASLPNGVDLKRVEAAKLDEPGETAYRATVTGAFHGETFEVTVVGFSKGRVAGFVYLSGTPVTADALALKLARRIGAVAARTISDKPVTATDLTPVQVLP